MHIKILLLTEKPTKYFKLNLTPFITHISLKVSYKLVIYGEENYKIIEKKEKNKKEKTNSNEM